MRLTVAILGRVVVGEEDLLDGQAEDARDGESQRQGGVVAAGLQGVDRLAGDPQLLASLAWVQLRWARSTLRSFLTGTARRSESSRSCRTRSRHPISSAS